MLNPYINLIVSKNVNLVFNVESLSQLIDLRGYMVPNCRFGVFATAVAGAPNVDVQIYAFSPSTSGIRKTNFFPGNLLVVNQLFEFSTGWVPQQNIRIGLKITNVGATATVGIELIGSI